MTQRAIDSVKLSALDANLTGGAVADPEALQAVIDDYAVKIDAIGADNGDMSTATTTAKTTVGAINELNAAAVKKDGSGRAQIAEPSGNVSGEIMNLSQYFNSAFSSGNVATSTAIADGGLYLLCTKTPAATNLGTSGLYLIARQGTQVTVTAIVTDSSVTVTVNASNQVVVTNSSGGARGLNNTLIRIGQGA